jgi:hypothetical protein
VLGGGVTLAAMDAALMQEMKEAGLVAHVATEFARQMRQEAGRAAQRQHSFGQELGGAEEGADGGAPQVRKTPSFPASWANFSPL